MTLVIPNGNLVLRWVHMTGCTNDRVYISEIARDRVCQVCRRTRASPPCSSLASAIALLLQLPFSRIWVMGKLKHISLTSGDLQLPTVPLSFISSKIFSTQFHSGLLQFVSSHDNGRFNYGLWSTTVRIEFTHTY